MKKSIEVRRQQRAIRRIYKMHQRVVSALLKQHRAKKKKRSDYVSILEMSPEIIEAKGNMAIFRMQYMMSADRKHVVDTAWPHFKLSAERVMHHLQDPLPRETVKMIAQELLIKENPTTLLDVAI